MARRAHLREVVVPVGTERPSVVMMDLPALAAQYPSVAADLKQAGLTAQQHDALRVALVNAYATQSVGKEMAAPDPSSPVAKNLAFLDAHPDELQALAQAGVQQLDAFADLGGTLPPDTTMIPGVPIPISVVRSPAATAELGPMGIWRTP
jgi:hypothetical protein